MEITFESVLECIIKKIREFVFRNGDISDEDIALTKLKDLNLPNDPHMPGISPAEALAIMIKSCVGENDVEISGSVFSNNPEWTVKQLAQWLFGQCDSEAGWES
jgi:hypothetical protein